MSASTGSRGARGIREQREVDLAEQRQAGGRRDGREVGGHE